MALAHGRVLEGPFQTKPFCDSVLLLVRREQGEDSSGMYLYKSELHLFVLEDFETHWNNIWGKLLSLVLIPVSLSSTIR